MKIITLLIGVIILSYIISGCMVGRTVVYNFAGINDYKKFPNRALTAANEPYLFFKSDTEQPPQQITINEKVIPFDKYLEDNKTVAFLIIKNDSIKYENYFNGYNSQELVASFSMAKSVTSMLIGCAIEDGYINSIDDKVVQYIPELQGFDNVTIKHLLQMTSGLKFDEGYRNPFGDAAQFYYGRNLRKKIAKMELEKEPGTEFEYKSGNTQLLGLIIERAVQKPVTTYLYERIWSKLGMETDASWSIDRKNDGLEKTYCCINATAIDFAKIGRLYLNEGNWNGKQLVSREWVKASTAVDTTNGSASYYQYQWWIGKNGEDYTARGILGQFIYVNPSKNLIIVRLGKNYGSASWPAIFTALAKKY